MASEFSGERLAPLAFVPATNHQRHLVLLTGVLLIACVGAVAPFANFPLPRWPVAVVAIDTVILVNDIITSALLFGQYSVVRSPALLALAGGYLFSGLIVAPHGLTFPGAFAPTGLFGAGLQGAALIYAFWHIGTPVSIFAYAVLARSNATEAVARRTVTSAIGSCIGLVAALVAVLTWVSLAGEQFLPVVFFDATHFTATAAVIGVVIIALSVIAFVAIWLGRRSVLDYWLMLVLLALISEQILTSLLISSRFSLGFYAGRAFSIVTSLVVLMLLLGEITKLYVRLARSHIALEREHHNRLMNVDAATAAVAHEIKQPLAAIVWNANASVELLELVPPNIREAKEAMRDVAADGDRMAVALDGVRTLFKTANERRELIDVNEIAVDVLTIARGEIIGHGVNAQSDLAPGMPLIMANKGQLQLVMYNLVRNAVEAMATTKDRLRTLRLVTKCVDRTFVTVAVQDTGPGIDPSQLNQMFDAFLTTKSQGTGLGLAICRVFIERHGGEISVWSDGTTGSIFQFRLPTQSKAASPP